VPAVFEQPAGSREAGKPVVLVVEDDPHISYYIYRCLYKDYELLFAPDGRQGEEKAFEIIPDLVISDVMMPYQDGFELCRKVKNDERTSHIPFILLTARADIEDRLEGLKRGADIYLAKPFQEEELHLHMRNLLRMQERLHAYFRDRNSDEELLEEGPKPSRNSDLESSTTLFDLQAENAFMEKVKGIIRKNISNPDFTMAELCRQMAMSSSQLHRKITALTSEPASKLLRRMRLDHARELLRHTQMNIGEVAFESGFNDPSYFTRIFNKDTGMTPTEYREHFFKKEF
jgi:YesN/AraC family two-component response regulator